MQEKENGGVTSIFHGKTGLFISVLSLCFLFSIGTSIYFFVQYQKTQSSSSNGKLSTSEAQALVNKVGQLMQLPPYETPTIATVSDVTKLHGQSFFVDAKNGDKVFIYAGVQKAILYRPSINKIINVGPISAQSQSVAGTQTGPVISESPLPSVSVTNVPVHVTLYNGTTNALLPQVYQKQLLTQFPNLLFSQTSNAQNNYPTTQVIDLDGLQTPLVNQIAAYLHATVGPLPVGEVKPSSGDILVILGQDKGK